MQGRVFSLVISGVSAMSPVGLAIAGPLADAFGVPIWFVISGIVTSIVAIASFFVPAIMNIEKKPVGVTGSSEVDWLEDIQSSVGLD
jgi:DHA3 family macrolide efflux protein-like MFS transporter